MTTTSSADILRRITDWKLISVLMYVEAIAAFETAMIYGAIGILYKLFGDATLVGWVITIYMLVSACMTPLIARLGDLYGRRMMTLIVLAVVTAGSLVSALSPNVEGLLIGRGLQGCAGSLMPLCLGLIREHCQRERMMTGTSVIAATAAIATGIGVLLGGWIADNLPWHSMFWFAAAATLLALAIGRYAIPPSKSLPPSERLDLLGGLLMIPTVAGALYAIGQGKYWGWIDLRTLGLLGASLAIGVVWFRLEWRHKAPLINVRLLAHREVMLTNLIMVLAAFGVFQVGPFLSMLLQQPSGAGIGFGLTATASGMVMLGTQMTALIGGPAAAVMGNRLGARRAMQTGAMLAAIGWVGMALAHDLFWPLVTLMFVQGIGSVMILSSAPMLLADAVPIDRTSEANGVTAVVRQTSFAVATQVTAFLLAAQTVEFQGSQFPAPPAVLLGFTMLASATVLCLLVTLALPRGAQRPPAGALGGTVHA